jgi:hypothetical protein
MVIVEGTAEKIAYAAAPATLSAASKKKYGWPIQPSKGGWVFRGHTQNGVCASREAVCDRSDAVEV